MSKVLFFSIAIFYKIDYNVYLNECSFFFFFNTKKINNDEIICERIVTS